jgi:hypothetical protein
MIGRRFEMADTPDKQGGMKAEAGEFVSKPVGLQGVEATAEAGSFAGIASASPQRQEFFVFAEGSGPGFGQAPFYSGQPLARTAFLDQSHLDVVETAATHVEATGGIIDGSIRSESSELPDLNKLHRSMVETAMAFETAIKSGRITPGGIGHNNPPEPIDEPWSQAEWTEVRAVLATVQVKKSDWKDDVVNATAAVSVVDKQGEKIRTFFGLTLAEWRNKAVQAALLGGVSYFGNEFTKNGAENWALVYERLIEFSHAAHAFIDAFGMVVTSAPMI